MTEVGAQRVLAPRTPQEAMFERFNQQTIERSGPGHVAGALLRGPGGLIRDVGGDHRVVAHLMSLFAIAVGFCAAYGAVLGMFGGAWWAAVKIPIVIVGSVLLCTPTLFVFNALGGSRLTYPQTVALALMMAASLSLILIAFAPVVWFFGVSTESFGFMTFLHLTVFLVAAAFGLRTLGTARRYLSYLCGSETLGSGLLVLWSILVIVVGLQMAHCFRPILLPGPFHTGQRGLFFEFVGALLLR